MDKALIDNKIVSAYEISLNYEKEKVVRNYSKDKKILCIDPFCENRVLRYCHGDKKDAYFAHLSNTNCDYNKFDKNDNIAFKELRKALFIHFSNLGYKVDTEYKALKHHYSQILCSNKDETFIIEFGDSKTTLGYIQNLLNEYSSKEINVKWLVLGNENLLVKENTVSFLKRFLLNESKNNDFILVNGNKITQYRLDKKVNPLTGNLDIYQETADLTELRIIDGELSINEYNDRFLLWQKEKESEIAKIIKNNKKIEENKKITTSLHKDKQSIIKKEPLQNPQQTSEDNLFKCEQCGKKADITNFSSYQRSTMSGLCYECLYGPERYKEILKLRGN